MSQDDPAELDDVLVSRIAAGDRRAFERLFAKYGARVFRYAYRLISDESKAEEVTNDVMMEVWKTAARFEGRSQVSTWILGITRHLALNAVRRKAFQTVDVDDPAVAIEDDVPNAAHLRDRDTLRAGLKRALGRLSPEHRDVVELTFFHDCSYQEIARILGCPENTVKTRMFHARKQLKGLLARAGLDPDNVEMAS